MGTSEPDEILSGEKGAEEWGGGGGAARMEWEGDDLQWTG